MTRAEFRFHYLYHLQGLVASRSGTEAEELAERIAGTLGTIKASVWLGVRDNPNLTTEQARSLLAAVGDTPVSYFRTMMTRIEEVIEEVEKGQYRGDSPEKLFEYLAQDLRGVFRMSKDEIQSLQVQGVVSSEQLERIFAYLETNHCGNKGR